MENKSGIVSLSFPFAAGVTAAALAAIPFEGAVASSLAVCLFIFISVSSGNRRSAAMAATFFCLGFMCWCTRALNPAAPRHSSIAIDALAARIDSLDFPGEHSAAILKALLTGRRNTLDSSTIAAFRKSGASHILALSGLHLGVLYLLIRTLLKPMGNSRAASVARSIMTIALCAAYTFITGASPSIVRAFLFILINETGRQFPSRRRSALGTFCTALTIQLAIRPDYISSAGFQLSYLAMLGITLVMPGLEAWYPTARGPSPVRHVWKCAALSISCQMFTAPVVWYHFRTFPKYFLITNLIAMPMTELAITGAALALLLDAMGLCPQLLVEACGTMVKWLEFCLEAIASI